MTLILQSNQAPKHLTAYFWSGDVIRSRSVSDVVLTETIEVPAPPARLTADWERDMLWRLELVPGDVEALSLARACARWPDYKRCVQAATDWTRRLGLQGVLATGDVALMACRGANYHHDAAQYAGTAFANLFMSEDKGLDLHFPSTGHRIPLVRGTAVIFDTGQPHAVIDRRSAGFRAGDFPPERDCSQVFITWEIPIDNTNLAQALGITLDTDPSNALQLHEEQVWLNGAPASVCPESGRWCEVTLTTSAAKD